MTVATARPEEVFASVYRTHASTVYTLAWRICGPALAAEVTQDVFMLLWRHPERFDSTRGSLGSFLRSVTHGRAVDVLRAETARCRREQRDISSRPSAEPDADQCVVERDRSARIARAIAELPPPERDAIVSAFYGERTYREVASVLGLPEGTVKSRIRSGVIRLRGALGDMSSTAEEQVA